MVDEQPGSNNCRNYDFTNNPLEARRTGHSYAKISFTFSRTFWLRDGFR